MAYGAPRVSVQQVHTDLLLLQVEGARQRFPCIPSSSVSSGVCCSLPSSSGCASCAGSAGGRPARRRKSRGKKKPISDTPPACRLFHPALRPPTRWRELTLTRQAERMSGQGARVKGRRLVGIDLLPTWHPPQKTVPTATAWLDPTRRYWTWNPASRRTNPASSAAISPWRWLQTTWTNLPRVRPSTLKAMSSAWPTYLPQPPPSPIRQWRAGTYPALSTALPEASGLGWCWKTRLSSTRTHPALPAQPRS